MFHYIKICHEDLITNFKIKTKYHTYKRNIKNMLSLSQSLTLQGPQVLSNNLYCLFGISKL